MLRNLATSCQQKERNETPGRCSGIPSGHTMREAISRVRSECHNTQHPGSDPVKHPARMRGWNPSWPEAHRRDDDPQPPQFRAFALPRISIATPRWARKGEGNGAEGVQTVPRQHSRAPDVRTYARTYIYIYIYTSYIHVTAFTLNPICLG